MVVVDELERLPLGRPWLINLGDRLTSRTVIGFYVSLERPSALAKRASSRVRFEIYSGYW